MINEIRHQLSLAGGILLLFGCGTNTPANKSADIKTFPVITLQYDSAATFTDYPATIQGIQNVEIRPKVDGYLKEMYVDEGATVKKGQLLFVISAPQYEEAVRTAEANIAIAESDVEAAKMQVKKVEPLVQSDIISAFELESAQYTLKAKQAALAQAKATYSNAKINLGYTIINSPADGVIGILPYKIGSLVSSTTTSPLTTVSNIQSIYAYFSINERKGLELFQTVKGKTIQQKLATFPPVSLVLADGNVLDQQGKVETASGLINAETGSMNMRATFPNPDALVRSGSSAVVRIPTTIQKAFLIPQQATYQIQGKLFAYAVDSSNKVKSVEIKPINTAGNNYVVTSGLQAGERIVADGISNLREGLQIKPGKF